MSDNLLESKKTIQQIRKRNRARREARDRKLGKGKWKSMSDQEKALFLATHRLEWPSEYKARFVRNVPEDQTEEIAKNLKEIKRRKRLARQNKMKLQAGRKRFRSVK